jgi:protein SCO1/2
LTLPSISRRDALLCLAALAAARPSLAAMSTAPLPGSSVYQLRPPLTDQDGQPFELSSLRGQPVLVSMFYSSCQMVCPMIFETIQLTAAALRPVERDRLRILMITFDPARDSTAVLKRTAQAHGCGERWSLVRTDEANSRKVAALLGVQYRRLTDGEFNHSSSIELLDGDGRIAARTSTLGAVDPAFVKKVRQSLAAAD